LIREKKKTIETEIAYRKEKEKQAKREATESYKKERLGGIYAGYQGITQDMSGKEAASKVFGASFRAGDTVNVGEYIDTVRNAINDKDTLNAMGLDPDQIGDKKAFMASITRMAYKRAIKASYYSNKSLQANLTKMGLKDEDAVAAWVDDSSRSTRDLGDVLAHSGVTMPSVRVPDMTGENGKRFAEAAEPKGSLNIRVSSDESESEVEENSRGQVTLHSKQHIKFSGTGLANMLTGFMHKAEQEAGGM